MNYEVEMNKGLENDNYYKSDFFSNFTVVV